MLSVDKIKFLLSLDNVQPFCHLTEHYPVCASALQIKLRTAFLAPFHFLKEGGFGVFRDAGLAIFYPRVFGFSLKNVRVFGFYTSDGLRVLPFSELGFREFRLKLPAFRF